MKNKKTILLTNVILFFVTVVTIVCFSYAYDLKDTIFPKTGIKSYYEQEVNGLSDIGMEINVVRIDPKIVKKVPLACRAVDYSTSHRDFSDRYIYNHLSDGQKKVYQAIYDEVVNNWNDYGKDEYGSEYPVITVIDTVGLGLNDDQLMYAFSSLVYDAPELYSLENIGLATSEDGSIQQLYIYSVPEYAQTSRRREIQNAIDRTKEELRGRLSNVSDLENRIYTITKFLGEKLDYANDEYDRPIVNNDTASAACLEQGRGICSGYSQAFTLLCRDNGVPVNTVVGFVPEGYHAWNTVFLNGSYYIVDSTFFDNGDKSSYLIGQKEAENRYITLPEGYDEYMHVGLPGVELADVGYYSDKIEDGGNYFDVDRYFAEITEITDIEDKDDIDHIHYDNGHTWDDGRQDDKDVVIDPEDKDTSEGTHIDNKDDQNHDSKEESSSTITNKDNDITDNNGNKTEDASGKDSSKEDSNKNDSSTVADNKMTEWGYIAENKHYDYTSSDNANSNLSPMKLNITISGDYWSDPSYQQGRGDEYYSLYEQAKQNNDNVMEFNYLLAAYDAGREDALQTALDLADSKTDTKERISCGVDILHHDPDNEAAQELIKKAYEEDGYQLTEINISYE